MTVPRVAVLPRPKPVFAEAVESGGGVVVGLDESPDALLWLSYGRTDELAAVLEEHPSIRWVQLPWAGVDVFAPVLAANGGGAIVNILSALSWFSTAGNGGYAAAKAAEWNMTNAVRLELAGQGTFVQGVHLGAADTDIMAGYDGPMIAPRDVPRASLDGLVAGSVEVVVDDWSRMVKDSLAGDPAPFYERMRAILG